MKFHMTRWQTVPYVRSKFDLSFHLFIDEHNIDIVTVSCQSFEGLMAALLCCISFFVRLVFDFQT